jgi:serine/threonine protein phosphatase PrpC
MITIAAWTHVGLVRGRNEDAIALPGTIIHGSPPAPISVRSATPKDGAGGYTISVIDGMGGHAGGAEASLLAALRLSEVSDDIDQALAAANSAMYDRMDQVTELRGMGATVAGIQIVADTVEVFNVGDARAYTHTDGYTTLASVDDRSESGSGEITQSLGGTVERTTLAVHRRTIELARPLRVLLCSDGLSEYVPFGEIQDSLDVADAVAAAGQLVSLALGAGGPDNVSVVVVDLRPADA